MTPYDLFLEICKVPRYSGHEARMGDWLMDWAAARHFHAVRDDAGGNGNVVVDAPATPGMEDRALVALQTHQDMVRAVKDGAAHDWNADPVRPVAENGWVHTEGFETSLGADDGIGMAIALAIADGGMPHGPLRLIMTVDEEDSQVGVKTLSPAAVEDARFLVNLDSEDEGEVTISSAIGDDNRFTARPTAVARTKPLTLKIRVSGLYGGHSGTDIDRGRTNGVIALGTLLARLSETLGLELCSFAGGSAPNAIPTTAEAVVAIDTADRAAVAESAAALQAAIAKGDDANAVVEVLESAPVPKALSAQDRDSLLRLVTGLQNGVVVLSRAVPGLVQTSSNLGIARVDAEGALLRAMARSSSEEDYGALVAGHSALAASCGYAWANVRNCEGWPADPSSPLLALVARAYRETFGSDIKVVAVHAGLECGAFKKMNPALDIVSIGPTVVAPHTVNERCDLASCDRVWRLLEAVLAAIPAN